MAELGLLFPAGGPVAPELMIARQGDVEDLVARLLERMHCLLTGPRRIGKTTVCRAVAQRLHTEADYTVLELEVPEQSTSADFCVHIVERFTMISLIDEARQAARITRPIVDKILEMLGLPLDLSQLGAQIPAQTRRSVLELPLKLAAETGRPVLLFIDELQRAVNYVDGVGLISDLVDIYAGSVNSDVVVLVDGSDERALDELVSAPYSLAKLTNPRALPPVIPNDQWREPLQRRFAEAGLEIPAEHLDAILDFAGGAPYPMMCAALGVAFRARQLEDSVVSAFAVQLGLEDTRGRLAADA
jgi:hypothetical protein